MGNRNRYDLLPMAATLTLNDATRDTFNVAKIKGKLHAGCNQVIKKILRKQATAVFLATDCADKNIGPVITELCKKNNIDLLVSTKAIIGEAAQLARYLPDGTVGKVVKTSTFCLTSDKENSSCTSICRKGISA